jgi:hypothetical protein
MFTIYSRDGQPVFTGTYKEITAWVLVHGLDGVGKILYSDADS